MDKDCSNDLSKQTESIELNERVFDLSVDLRLGTHDSVFISISGLQERRNCVSQVQLIELKQFLIQTLIPEAHFEELTHRLHQRSVTLCPVPHAGVGSRLVLEKEKRSEQTRGSKIFT